eukprot:1878464-Rhodomonas_salina.2
MPQHPPPPCQHPPPSCSSSPHPTLLPPPSPTQVLRSACIWEASHVGAMLLRRLRVQGFPKPRADRESVVGNVDGGEQLQLPELERKDREFKAGERELPARLSLAQLQCPESEARKTHGWPPARDGAPAGDRT